MAETTGRGDGSASDGSDSDSWQTASEDFSASVMTNEVMPLQEERKDDLERDEVLPEQPRDQEEEVTGIRHFTKPEESVSTCKLHPEKRFTEDSTGTSQGNLMTNDSSTKAFITEAEVHKKLTMLGAKVPDSPSTGPEGAGSKSAPFPNAVGGSETQLAEDVLADKPIPHNDYRRASKQLAETVIDLNERIQVLEKQKQDHQLDVGRRDEIAREIENLKGQKHKLEQEIEQLHQSKKLVAKAVPEKAQKLVKSYVACSSHDGNECLACEVKQSRQLCWKCEHSASAHRCRSCDSCKWYEGKKAQNECNSCGHEKSDHGCTVCETCKQFSPLVIADSHGYPKAALREMCNGDEYRIFDGKQSQSKKPSNCGYRQLCSRCENGTAKAEDSFVKCLKSVRKDPKEYHHLDHQIPAPVSGYETTQITSVHADLLYVFSFRALPQSTELGHYNECRTCLSHYPHILRWVVRARECVMHSKWKHRDADVDKELIHPADAGMLFHLKLSEPPSSHLTEYPIICNVEYEKGQWMAMIYAQIPPFYWAFPLVEDQQVPDEFPEQATTAKQLSEYCPQTVEAARDLTPHFPTLVDAINEKLLEKRAKFLHQETRDQKVQRWHDSLTKEEQDIEDKMGELRSQREGNKVEEEKLKNDWEKWEDDCLSKEPQQQYAISQESLDERKKQLEKRERQLNSISSKYHATLEETKTKQLTVQNKKAGASQLRLLIYYLPDCCLDIPIGKNEIVL